MLMFFCICSVSCYDDDGEDGDGGSGGYDDHNGAES